MELARQNAGLRSVGTLPEDLPGQAGSNSGISGPFANGKVPVTPRLSCAFGDELGIRDAHRYGGLGSGAGGGRGQERASAGASDTGGCFIDGQRDAAHSAAALRAIRVGGGHANAVALEFEIEIVFERERDGVLQGKVELAGADQTAYPRGIAEIGNRHRTGSEFAAKKTRIPDDFRRAVGCACRLRANGRDLQATQRDRQGLRRPAFLHLLFAP